MPPTTNRVELRGRMPRTQTTSGGGCMIPFGMLFMAAGLGFGWFLYRNPTAVEVPSPVLYGGGALFLLAGLTVSLSGVFALFRGQRTARRLREHPDEPWLGDHPWNPEGERERPFAKALRSLVGLLGFALFLAPFNAWMVVTPHPFLILAVGLFDLLLVAAAAYSVFEIVRALKYGAAWVRYERFPFYLGDTVSLRLGCGRSLQGLETIVVTLRFVREVSEHQGHSTNMVCYQHWADSLTFRPEQLANGEELRVSFALPPAGQDLETCLSEAPPTYWEIEMKGEAPGIDLESTFLLPVYRRAGAPSLRGAP